MELIIQFCYLNIFSLCFPASYLMGLANNIAEIQVDKYKLLIATRRPIPKGARNIGIWYTILEMISFISIFVNAGIICFTSKVIESDR